jgi:site-specific DNA recombinase
MHVILANETVGDARRDPLIGLLVRVYQAQVALTIEADRTKSEKDQLSRLARLTYLAPDIVGTILAGRQPASLTARTLARVGKLPIDWVDQRRALGF